MDVYGSGNWGRSLVTSLPSRLEAIPRFAGSDFYSGFSKRRMG
jgi:hypothetical protein